MEQTKRQSARPLGERLFSFGVIADSHLNQDEAKCNAPFEVNRLANARMRQVVRELNHHEVDFIIHLGDLIHPVPAVKGLYLQAAQRFKNQIQDLKQPIHLVPGNHDVGDKPVRWTPAVVVNDAFLDLWGETFGDHYYSFDHEGCHFVVINAQIINSGLAAEQKQRAWLEKDLASHAGKRTFLSTHYPPFLCHRQEEEHYDNITEPGRTWLLDLIDRYALEALFAGHVHNFWYLRFAETDFYLLPSTSFVRQDYSEMFKAPQPPEFEFGRNDLPKLGYFVVHIHQNGHTFHFYRTYGLTAEPGSQVKEAPRKDAPIYPRENFRAPLGFDLRESWAEPVGIPPSGGLDEFDRKMVRNDYPVLALWEMGVRSLRVPLQDLKNPATLQRMRDLIRQGHEFTLFSFGVPSGNELAVICQNSDLLSAWEVAFDWDDLEDVAKDFTRMTQESQLPLYLSKLWRHDRDQDSDKPYFHVVNHGFKTGDAALVAQIKAHRLLSGAVSGVVFRISGDDEVWNLMQSASAICQENGLRTSLHLRMAQANPALPTCDDLWAANRVAEALMAAVAYPDLKIFVDTLVDIDRGYFVRNGVLDHFCNPRLGARVIGHLSRALNGNSEAFRPGTRIEGTSGTCVTLSGETMDHLLFMPNQAGTDQRIPLPFSWEAGENRLIITELDSGEKRKVSPGDFSGNVLALKSPGPILVSKKRSGNADDLPTLTWPKF